MSVLLKGAKLRDAGAVDYEGVFVRPRGHFQPGLPDELRLEVSEAVTSLECLGSLCHPLYLPYGSSFFNFWGNLYTLFHSDYQFTSPPPVY